MLDRLYMGILDMSKTASLVILVVILARLLLKKTPKLISYTLWIVVLFRLFCPVTFETPVGLIPQLPPTSTGYNLADEPIDFAGAGIAAYQAVGDALNGGLGVQHIPTTEKSEDGMTRYVTTDWWSVWILFGKYVWIAGMAAMLLYSAISYRRIKRNTAIAVRLRDNIWIADDIQSPFVIGFIKPKIYLPCHLSEKEQDYIILHEKHHINRLDHVIKALAFLALTIHWFNPLVWVAFVLSSKDMEMSCDEAVIRKMGSYIRADYSASLLTLATGHRIIAGTPLAFGEGDTKGRIKNLAKWKKPAIWIVVLSVLLCAVLVVCLITNPVNGKHLYEIDDSRNYSDLLLNRETVILRSYGKESTVTDLEGFLSALDDIKVSKKPISPSRSEDRDSSHRIILDGRTYINFSWNYATVWIDNRVKPTYTYMVANPLEVSRIFSTFGGNSGEGPQDATIQELTPGTTYVPYQCIYMNPLSSYAAMGGDSGCKYIFGGDYFVTIHRDNGNIVSITSNPDQETLDNGTGEQKTMIAVLDWDWKAFPYTDQEWEDMYFPKGFGAIERISEKFDKILHIRISPEILLLNMDGSLWLVNLSNDPKVGTYIWSIYSLVPESAMGFAQWEFAPMLSSRLPVFRIEFDMKYTSIQASCNAGLLVPWDNPGSSSDTVMTYKEGCALYWSPANEDSAAVTSAKILFTVMNGDTPVYQGNIYLEGDSGSGGRRIYNASLVGAGLYLAPNMENEGAVISSRDPMGEVEQIQLYDLTRGNLEIPIEELGNYAFYTNSTKISVKVKSNQEFEGNFTLIDVSQNNAEIAGHNVTIKDKTCEFTNLTSARIYRLEYAGLEGCTLVIS